MQIVYETKLETLNFILHLTAIKPHVLCTLSCNFWLPSPLPHGHLHITLPRQS